MRNQRMEMSVIRQRLMWEVKNAFPELSLHQIGRHFNGRDHTTVLHAIRQHERRLSGELVKMPTRYDGETGIYFNKNRNKWHSTVRMNGHHIHLGSFAEKEEAIRVRRAYLQGVLDAQLPTS